MAFFYCYNVVIIQETFMFIAMDSWLEYGTTYQRALRHNFKSLEKAIAYAKRKATGKAFVCKGVSVVWVNGI